MKIAVLLVCVSLFAGCDYNTMKIPKPSTESKKIDACIAAEVFDLHKSLLSDDDLWFDRAGNMIGYLQAFSTNPALSQAVIGRLVYRTSIVLVVKKADHEGTWLAMFHPEGCSYKATDFSDGETLEIAVVKAALRWKRSL